MERSLSALQTLLALISLLPKVSYLCFCHNVCEPVIELCHSLWVLQGSSLPDSGNNMPAQIVLTRKRATRIWRKVRLQQSSHLC